MGLRRAIKNQMPKTKGGKTILVIFAILLPIGVGVFAGYTINKHLIPVHADYSNVNIEDLKDNTAANKSVMDKYNAAVDAGADLSTIFQPYEMINLAYSLYSQHEVCAAITEGYTDTINSFISVHQIIYASAIKNGDDYFEESLSKSNMVGVAKRMYMSKDTGVTQYTGTIDTPSYATWDANKVKEYTKEEYTTDFGKTLDDPCIYIISKKTILKDSASVTKDANNNYIVSVSLHPINGVAKYVRQMKNISDLNAYPSFMYVNLTYTLNDKLLPTLLHIDESYNADSKMGSSDLKASLDIRYSVDDGTKIPSLTENISYREVK